MAAPMLVLTAIAAIATVASCAYCLLCIFAGLRFTAGRSAELQPSALPPVSILKPLKGTDPGMYEALRSHCLQDYPQFEVLCGVGDRNDPAIPVAEKLIEESPQRAIRLLVCEKKLGANGKVSTLAQLAALANHELLVVNDSDIRVGPDYLRTVVTELGQPGVGLITSLYRAVPAGTLASRLEALGISTDFVPGILAARLIERRLRFALGATLALRKRDLQAIGGFEAIAGYLADDYELGRRIAASDLGVKLSRCVVETHVPDYHFGQFFSHQLRWARTIRGARPRAYFGLPLTFTLPWAMLGLVLARGAGWAWLLLGVAAALRLTMAAVMTSAVLDDKPACRWLWLVSVRDLLAVAVWAAG